MLRPLNRPPLPAHESSLSPRNNPLGVTCIPLPTRAPNTCGGALRSFLTEAANANFPHASLISRTKDASHPAEPDHHGRCFPPQYPFGSLPHSSPATVPGVDGRHGWRSCGTNDGHTKHGTPLHSEACHIQTHTSQRLFHVMPSAAVQAPPSPSPARGLDTRTAGR
jgi:hypothetical protein